MAAARPPVRPIVLIPTYDEAQNLERIIDAVLGAQPSFHILVIDDNSPDGTGEIAQRRADADARVHVLHRAGKEGLGRAYLSGFAWALAQPVHYTHVFEMDADFSHDPRHLGALLRACDQGADVAIGSRYVPGGATVGWTWPRKLISRGGGLYAKTVLGVDVQDLTTGYKCFRRQVLETLPLDRIVTSGYGFQIEMTYRSIQHGFRVKEVPIVFPDRTQGDSKMSLGIFVEALTVVWKLRLRER